MFSALRTFPDQFPPPIAWVGVILGFFATAVQGAAAADGSPFDADTRLYLSYAARPDRAAVLAHDLCILDPASDAPLAEGRKLGTTFLAYVSAVEVIPGTATAQKAMDRGIAIVDRNAGWSSDVLDITHASWADWLVNDAVRPALEKGYDGVFLDTLDSTMRIVMKRPSMAKACREALVGAIQRIRREFPGRRIVINRGFDIVADVASAVDGVLVEGLYQTWSPETRRYLATRVEGTEWLLSHISRIQEKNLPVFVVDYVPAGDAALARAAAARIASHKCIPFITTPDLQGEELAPMREVPRRVAVLHGWQAQDGTRPAFSADTFSAELLQGPLEWLGCELEFIDAGTGVLPALPATRYRGVIVDADLQLPLEREEAFADWLVAQQQHGIKLLFAGTIPFRRDQAIRRLFKALGMTGGNVPMSPSGVAASESRARAVLAPPGAKILLKASGKDAQGNPRQLDAAFVASWGGALLLSGLPESHTAKLDLVPFMEGWVGAGNSFPAPDVTTRDGMRVLFSHLDGDGFVQRSTIEGGPLCGEVVRDRILKAFPLPVTVSVIESEIECQVSGQDPLAAQKHRDLARSVFVLPNVQPASHTFSHPYVWQDRDPVGSVGQPERHLDLKLWVNYAGTVDVDREIRGSIEYLNRVLLPRDKRAELLLWTGSCRPGAGPLRLCRELDVDSINGGAPLRQHVPGLETWPPSHATWEGELQVYSAAQNSFKCTMARPAPFFESAQEVIAGFSAGDKPRRVKPVNPCADFHAGTYATSIRALEQIFSWCMEQPLHALTARQYAQTVRDAAATRIYETGSGRWLLCNDGHARTFRISASSDEPDIAASKGVTGWLRDESALYVHTNGSPRIELVMRHQPAPHLRLAQSSAEIVFRALTPVRAEFTVSDLRPVKTTFAGAPPDSACDLVVNGQTMRLKSDSQGVIALHLPATANVTLDFPASRLANRN